MDSNRSIALGLISMVINEFNVGSAIVRFIRSDITDIATKAIVNAANSSLMGGGGVDGAIHRRGGPRILEECRRIRAEQYPDGLPTGKAVLTSGGDLKARYVIHTVGPIWHGGTQNETELLYNAYMNSLKLAVTNKLRSVAFPSVSTGAYGYPIEKASKIAVKAVKAFLETEDSLDEVVFVLFSELDLMVYLKTANEEI